MSLKNLTTQFVGLFSCKTGGSGCIDGQVHISVSEEQIGVARSCQAARQRRAGQATVVGDVNFHILNHLFAYLLTRCGRRYKSWPISMGR